MRKVLLLIMAVALVLLTACKAEVNVYLDESDEAFTDDNSSVDDTEDITDTESATSSDDEGMQVPAENNNASGDKSEGKKPTGSTDDKKPASSGGQSGTTPTPTPMPSGSATQEYTVTFNSNGGSAVSAAKTVGGKVTKPADPTRSGYKFMGWYKQGSSTAWNFGDKVTADITLVATWEDIEYNVTFDSAGGSAVAAAKTVGGKVTKPADPTRSGYKFMGWYKQGSSTAWNFGDKVTADITLVAKWELIEYTVTFNSDGGSAVASTKTSGKVTKPADPTRSGYKFMGWYKQGSSTAWNFDDKVTADITLVAKWEIVEYTVTFIFNNDENNNEIYSTVNHKVVTKPADPEKKNCKFTGWCIQGTNTKWNFDDETFADLVLVADWTIAGDHSPIIPFD